MLGWLPGASALDIVEREEAQGSLNSTGTKLKDGSWNWQDSFGAWLAGTNKNAIEQQIIDRRNDRLTTALGGSARLSQRNLGDFEPTYQGVKGITEDEARAQIAIDTARGNALEEIEASVPGVDLSGLSRTAGVGAIKGAGATQLKQNNLADEEKIYNRRIGRENELLKRQELIQERADIRQDERLAQDRFLTAQTNQMQIGLQYAQLAQQEKNRREDREEKAFLRILSGLNNLGQAFLI